MVSVEVTASTARAARSRLTAAMIFSWLFRQHYVASSSTSHQTDKTTGIKLYQTFRLRCQMQMDIQVRVPWRPFRHRFNGMDKKERYILKQGEMTERGTLNTLSLSL